jgi:hypothetical protein
MITHQPAGLAYILRLGHQERTTRGAYLARHETA